MKLLLKLSIPSSIISVLGKILNILSFNPIISMFIKNECSDIAHTEKYDGIFSPTFVVDDFSGSFLHPSVFYIKDSRSA